MKLNDICLDIPANQTINFVENGIVNSNNTLTFIDSWGPPLIYTPYGSIICGPIIKIIEELSKRHGYKYVKIKNHCYEISHRKQHLSLVSIFKIISLDAIQFS
jgi:hypothetical protein